jgi:hypothetical protein
LSYFVTTSVAAYWIADVLSRRRDAAFVFDAVVAGFGSKA